MISSLELCQIVESSFLPSKCQCSVDASGLMAVQLFSPGAGQADLLVTGIPVSSLSTSRAIASLITGLKEELRLRSAKRGAGIGKESEVGSVVRNA